MTLNLTRVVLPVNEVQGSRTSPAFSGIFRIVVPVSMAYDPSPGPFVFHNNSSFYNLPFFPGEGAIVYHVNRITFNLNGAGGRQGFPLKFIPDDGIGVQAICGFLRMTLECAKNHQPSQPLESNQGIG